MGPGFRLLGMFLALAFATCGRPAMAATQPGDAEIAQFFDRHVARAIAEGEVPGAALVVVRDGRIILSRGYGLADLGRREAMSPSHHLLRQGSVSKLVPWVLAMQLAEAGKLDLDRDVNAYLPFRIAPAFGQSDHDAAPANPHRRVRRALHRRLRAALEPAVPGAQETTFRSGSRPPGQRISYSNSGAALAACIVERIAGKDFERLSTERVLQPAGMSSSTVRQPPPARLQNRLATFYGASSDQPHSFEYIAIAPAGALSATAQDMGRLLLASCRGSAANADQLLKPETLEGDDETPQAARAGLGVGHGAWLHRPGASRGSLRRPWRHHGGRDHRSGDAPRPEARLVHGHEWPWARRVGGA